ncbi:hypothetical protein DE146DRAFT_724413 [Phaeosphaeria sp. MPI-PUGE-AT-0046c]|nr:hypothetical protein DE146DRAFT_724413 [Phaeosphaeria sp. MPI-PUGE-AT-0046c]
MPLQTQGKRRAAASEPPVKRFRVSRACDQCRTERSKCDGNQPQCAPCSETSRECSYTFNPKKRGLPPGYIRTIELALALVFQEHADIEASLIAKLGQQDTVLVARDTKESIRLHRNWRKTQFYREMNRTLTGQQSGNDHEDVKTSGDDSDGALELETSISYVLPEPLLLQGASQPDMPQMNYNRPSMSQNSSATSLTTLPHECWQMLEDYSRYTQCWFPISEKLDILKLSYLYPSQGLLLSPDMPEAGHHAEMWSMMALSSDQGRTDREPIDFSTSRNYYSIAKDLIPTELGKFQIGHVKALLNLALVNLQGSFNDAAWILVGAASRILPTIRHQPESPTSRYTHVVASCYLLDNLLALSLDRRPYLNRSDIERAGTIEEDGLEEWQPWVGELNTMTGHQSRSPALALSSFNRLIDLVDILVRSGRHPRVRSELIRELADWKTALPSKLEYLRSEPVCKGLPVERAVQLQFEGALSNLKIPFGTTNRELSHVPTKVNNVFLQDQYPQTVPAQGMPTSYSPQFSVPVSIQQHQQQQNRRQQAYHPTSLLDDLLPDMNPNRPQEVPQTTNFSPNPVDTDLTSPALDTYDPSISGDLESFFDELASLHGAKKLQNQPQFMQNLGFAPEVSMADLLATQSGHFMPSTFGTENQDEPVQFPLSDFYNTS